MGNNGDIMSDKINNDMLIAEALIRIFAIEKLLEDKGIITSDDFHAEMEKVAIMLARNLLQKANIPGDIDAIIGDFKTNKGSNN